MCIHIQKKLGGKKANQTTRELYSVVVISSVQESNSVHWPKVQETLRQNHTSLTLRLLTILISWSNTQYCGVQKHILTLSKSTSNLTMVFCHQQDASFSHLYADNALLCTAQT